ncbi:MAG: hypothetical protein Q9209_000709 [Squamulea sp. 1 TL-2023]
MTRCTRCQPLQRILYQPRPQGKTKYKRIQLRSEEQEDWAVTLAPDISALTTPKIMSTLVETLCNFQSIMRKDREPWTSFADLGRRHPPNPRMEQPFLHVAFEVQDGTLGEKINRINADPLVGLPMTNRSYSAAGTRKVDVKSLKFLKRPEYYAMFVKGFVLHRVGVLEERSQSGHLPRKWFNAGGWYKWSHDPPEGLWRTLVANRGPDGRNPLSFYPTALRVSTEKGWKGTILDTHELINHGRCSIVAQFFRRVQGVVWNKKLMHTKKELGRPERLGLVHQSAQEGDLICIFYGCSVPVVLRKVDKSEDEIKAEQDLIELEAALKIH